MGDHEPGGSCWFTVLTKPRQERVAEEHLSRQGFECYLPRAWNPSQKLPSQNPRVEPLFPRYVFVQANPQQQSVASVNFTRGVSKLVKFGSLLIQVPEWVIGGLKRATDSLTGLVQIERPEFQAGDRVEVFDGPFSGLRGIFQATDGESRAILLLDLLGKENAVSVEYRCLRSTR